MKNKLLVGFIFENTFSNVYWNILKDFYGLPSFIVNKLHILLAYTEHHLKWKQDEVYIWCHLKTQGQILYL